jgi:glycosyltransferase involved in cell wall biosynthesis
MSCDVSVIVPTYNSSGTLGRALESVYRQSLLPREIMVVDDGSEDWEQSRLIVACCPESIAIRFIHLEKNQGPSTARNVGVAAARCLYLAFLDSDDVWFPQKLAIQYGLMISQHLDFSLHRYFGDIKYARSDESDSNHSRPISCAPLSAWTPLLRNDSTNSVMVLREKMVAYDTSLRQGEDFECYMELLSKPDVRALYINRVLAGGFKSTLGVSGLSGNVKAMHAGRMLALRKLINRGNIGRAQYVFGISTEMVKYPLRFLRTWFNRRTGPFRLARAKGSKANNYGKQPGSAHADP